MPAEGQAHYERKPFSGGEKGFVVRTIIIANGEVPEGAFERYPVRDGDWLIAADGGARVCLGLGLLPELVIGDFDSLSNDEQDRLRQENVQFIQHPARKDYTDLELALQHAVEGGAAEILVFGALGDRWDQSLANVLLAGLAEWEGVRIWLLHGEQRMTCLRGGEELELEGRRGDIVSLLPIGGDAVGVATQGLEYPLDDERLHFGATRGVSNRMLGQNATVSLGDGKLIVVMIHGASSERSEVRA